MGGGATATAAAVFIKYINTVFTCYNYFCTAITTTFVLHLKVLLCCSKTVCYCAGVLLPCSSIVGRIELARSFSCWRAHNQGGVGPQQITGTTLLNIKYGFGQPC